VSEGDVVPAPQHRAGGDGDQQPAVGAQHPERLRRHLVVLVDVLPQVGGEHQVDRGVGERQPAGVAPHRRDAAGGHQLGRRGRPLQCRDVPPEFAQHGGVTAGAGADVDRAAAVDATQQPPDQGPPPGVPPVALLERG
jgi:hypothetical protein